MADALKDQYDEAVPRWIAQRIRAVHPGFDSRAFVRDALRGYDALGLMQRGQHMADALARHLPADYRRALGILLATLGPPLADSRSFGMAPFRYLPHTLFVARYGLGHFEASMQAQHALTQRFTAEFSLRAFLLHHPERTLQQLHRWTRDDSEHVRRLVSEGTRPRLPWAPQLQAFRQDPRPVLALLEQLKDDDSLYVRRSVANNLNDIGKDHPALLHDTARRWLAEPTPQRRWLVNHALRSAVKRADPAALSVLGYGQAVKLTLRDTRITPARPALGSAVAIHCTLHNPLRRKVDVLADLRIHYVKANGRTSAKTFKLKKASLGPGEALVLQKTLSLAEMTTRRHYPGKHRVELLVNGRPLPLGSFLLRG